MTDRWDDILVRIHRAQRFLPALSRVRTASDEVTKQWKERARQSNRVVLGQLWEMIVQKDGNVSLRSREWLRVPTLFFSDLDEEHRKLCAFPEIFRQLLLCAEEGEEQQRVRENALTGFFAAYPAEALVPELFSDIRRFFFSDTSERMLSLADKGYFSEKGAVKVAERVPPDACVHDFLLQDGGETVTNGHVVEEVMLNEMFDNIAKESDYYRKSREYGYGSGRGIGVSFYNHGGAFTGNGEQAIIKAHARLRKEGERVIIEVGSTEMGQGFQTILRKIAAAVLEIPIENVDYPNPDTSCVPDSGPTAASRSTMIVGRLIERCAQEMKERWGEGDFTVEKEYEHPDGFPWDQSTFRGDAYLGYGWGAAIVELEIDRRTNEVVVKGIWSSHEIGKAIDELIVHGQINGGVIQSLGYASMEKMENRNGHFKQTSMSDYVIPTSMDFPEQYYHIQENPYEFGPFGAKGMGELVFNGADAAYVDALERAIGKEVYKIPLPPEDIEEALRNA